MIQRLVVAFFAVFLAVPAYAQDKPVVGVVEMVDLAKTGQSDTFIAMLETAIVGSGKFRIIERSRLETLLKEQGLAQGGITRTNRPGQRGGFEGVDYLVYGTITSVSAVQKSDFFGSLANSVTGGGSNGDCQVTEVRMEADIRITDTSTGEIRYTKRISEVQESATVCSGGAQIDSSGLFRASADKIATGLVTTIFPIQVAAIQSDGTFILNYGEGAVQVGDYLMFYGEGMSIPDPSGGGMIKIDGEQIGAIQVTDVQSAFSRAVQVTSFASEPAVGAIARPTDKKVVKAMQKADRKRKKRK